MKYFYQQLFGFLAVALVTISVCGGMIYSFNLQNIYLQRAQQLSGYAQSIIVNQLTSEELQQATKLMENEHVQIAIFDKNNYMTYPFSTFVQSSTLSQSELLRLRGGEIIQFRRTNFSLSDTEMVTIYYPIFKSQEYSGFIAIGSPVSRIQAQLNELRDNLILAFGIATLVAMLLSLFFARYQTIRINRLRKATHEIAQGNFDIEIPTKSKDEFDDLATDFNQMVCSLKKSEQEIDRQENLRRQFMMDVAHEMRTPLTTMNGLLEGLAHNMIPESRRERSLELISNETQRLIRLVNENLDYEKIRSDQIVLTKQVFDGKKAFQTVVDQLQELSKTKENSLSFECSDNFKIYADYDRFVQILFNITKNAIQFTDHGNVLIKGYQEKNDSVIEISDSGIGISAKEIESIWERFYKADVSRKSTKYGESGIGLAIVKSLVNRHNGTIDVTSQENVGTTFTIRLPKA